MAVLWNKIRSVLSQIRNEIQPERQFEMNNSSQDKVSACFSQAIKQLENFPQLQDFFNLCRQCLYRPLQVAIVGEYNAGKSTFLNAMLQEALLPTGDLPTTGCVNYIRFGEQFSIVAHYKNGNAQSLNPEEFRKISSHDHSDLTRYYELQQFKYIEVFKPAKILEKIVFVDTPGLNAPTEADREITEDLLNKSDAIIWLTAARQVLAASEVDILEAFSERYKGKSLCVISQIDSLNNPKKEVPLLLNYAKETLSDYFADIVAVSALEAIKGNDEQMRPFYQAFWQHIIPKSQEIVIQSILFDARRAIEETIKDIEKGKDRLKEVRNSLYELQQKAGRIADDLLGKIKKISNGTVNEFRQIQNQLITRIQQELDTWTDYEPYTKKIQGVFVDDYVVAHKQIQRWMWPDEAVKETGKWVITESENIMEEFRKDCTKAHEDAIDRIDKLNTEFKDQNEDVVDGSDINTLAQHLMMTIGFKELIENKRLYFWGAMRHGGVEPVSRIIFFDKSKSRLTAARVTELVTALLPIQTLIESISDNQHFEESIRASINICYEWIENKISNQTQHIDALIKELENTNNLILK